jgi:hypothetical protein
VANNPLLNRDPSGLTFGGALAAGCAAGLVGGAIDAFVFGWRKSKCEQWLTFLCDAIAGCLVGLIAELAASGAGAALILGCGGLGAIVGALQAGCRRLVQALCGCQGPPVDWKCLLIDVGAQALASALACYFHGVDAKELLHLFLVEVLAEIGIAAGCQ